VQRGKGAGRGVPEQAQAEGGRKEEGKRRKRKEEKRKEKGEEKGKRKKRGKEKRKGFRKLGEISGKIRRGKKRIFGGISPGLEHSWADVLSAVKRVGWRELRGSGFPVRWPIVALQQCCATRCDVRRGSSGGVRDWRC
jgi:hypothetical protein